MHETVTAIVRVLPGGGGFPSLVETQSGRRVGDRLRRLPVSHFLAGQRVAPLSADISAAQLNEIVAALPDSWIAHMPPQRSARQPSTAISAGNAELGELRSDRVERRDDLTRVCQGKIHVRVGGAALQDR